MSCLGRLDSSLNFSYFSLICLTAYLEGFNMSGYQNNTCFPAGSVCFTGNMSVPHYFFCSYEVAVPILINTWFVYGNIQIYNTWFVYRVVFWISEFMALFLAIIFVFMWRRHHVHWARDFCTWAAATRCSHGWHSSEPCGSGERSAMSPRREGGCPRVPSFCIWPLGHLSET